MIRYYGSAARVSFGKKTSLPRETSAAVSGLTTPTDSFVAAMPLLTGSSARSADVISGLNQSKSSINNQE